MRHLGTLAVFSLAALVYAISSGPELAHQSYAPHFVYLANAFAHGKLDLGTFPPPSSEEGDWTLFHGHWTIAFPPLPSLLMVPFVLVYGKAFNDIIFTLLFAAANVALVFNLLPAISHRLIPNFKLEAKARWALTASFAFGTVHWWLASFGMVWFTGQIVGLTFLLLALRETLVKGRPLLVGLSMALAGLSRPTMLLALPVLVWLLYPYVPLRRQLVGLLPLALAGIGMGWYNHARFGDPLELGYRYMLIEKLLAGPLDKYGQFSLAHLGRNLYWSLVALPKLSPKSPFVLINPWGLSIFISTPALLFIFFAPWREKLAQACLLGAVCVAIPSLLYYTTGYMQFGYRFILDYIPFLMVLVALGMRGRLTKPALILILVSIAMGFFQLINFRASL